MLPDTTIKRLNSLGQIAKNGKRVNGLFRLMEDPFIWKQAYANIAPNKGANTKGIDDVTMDGFSVERIDTLVSSIKEGVYTPQPVRRTYIPKKNGKQRPLGIPNGNDKLVQEVCRILLEQIYEPNFSIYSHGFRKEHSCHTALEQVHARWTGTKWLIIMDIKGFFDNINHEVMLSILSKRIDDKRFIKLIEDMLKAGYVEDWKYNKTYSGTPQGGIISPILANIYLNELDLFIGKLANEFNLGKERAENPEYRKYRSKISNLTRKITKLQSEKNQLPSLRQELLEIDGEWENMRTTRKDGYKTSDWKQCRQKKATLEAKIKRIEINSSEENINSLLEEIKTLKTARDEIPYGDPYDANYKRLNYCRYADDFILGVIGSKAEAQELKEKIERFIKNELLLEIEPNKTAIVKAEKGVDFLGYKIQSYNNPVKRKMVLNGKTTTLRSNGRIQLIIPYTKLQNFCNKNGYGDLATHKPTTRPYLVCLSDAEIISTYNAELRGLVNYYSLGNSSHRKLEPVVSLARTSCAMTLAHKHRTTTTKIIKSMVRADGEWVRKVPTSDDFKEFRLYRLKTDGSQTRASWNVDMIANTSTFRLARTELLQRLEAQKCEVCGSKESIEVHHIRALKDIKNSTSLYDQLMMARQRKTLVLCSACHHKLHAGKL